MAIVDRTDGARPAPGGRALGRAGPAGPQADGWRDWFAPARGLRPRGMDLCLAAAIAVVQVGGTISYGADEPSRWPFDAFAYGLLVAGPVALLFRRRWPEATLAVTVAAAAGYAATGYPRGPAGFPALVFALVSAVMLGRRAFAWAVLAVAYPAFVWLPSLVPDEVEARRTLRDTATTVAWLPLVGAASEMARVRLERRDERAHVAHEEARRRASEERLLIARELHDVLAHNISLVNVQAGVALHLLEERPEQARPALHAIKEASKEALGELRSVLDVLSRDVGEDGAHEDEGAHGEDPGQGESGTWAPRSPTAGLRDLEGLVRRTRAAGLDVHLAVEGEARPVPAGVDLAAFRIVQEAVTNVVRHAGAGARATVRLVYAPDELVVHVDDDGRVAGPVVGSATAGAAVTAPATDAPATAGSGGTPRVGGVPVAGEGTGRGIAGMRERVRALGGTFAAGPRPGRGFRVRAQLPARGDGLGHGPGPSAGGRGLGLDDGVR